ncbi:hypothetical protein B0T26DRAFT_68351 [Lasiosphaeria miniovina]|uniref:Uncharacterized protein n=1 Tax=Lasiosphaeria miniovina TaxID=1954250 RepID=A0AA40EAH0_9PEZI|nr:uncharacterized protein B0T26DRAFT_68351 [Lasiosphaeria miniovina]KAK0734389.1 hypothetical protein B0T26DRAFT_68351 [Lasiosphaeria miniovina]
MHSTHHSDGGDTLLVWFHHSIAIASRLLARNIPPLRERGREGRPPVSLGPALLHYTTPHNTQPRLITLSHRISRPRPVYQEYKCTITLPLETRPTPAFPVPACILFLEKGKRKGSRGSFPSCMWHKRGERREGDGRKRRPNPAPSQERVALRRLGDGRTGGRAAGGRSGMCGCVYAVRTWSVPPSPIPSSWIVSFRSVHKVFLSRVLPLNSLLIL